MTYGFKQILKKELSVYLYNRDETGQLSAVKVRQTLWSKIDKLEEKISLLCQASKDADGPNVCGL